MTEAEIIEKLRNGSEAAFRHLVENYQQRVINVCFGMLHNMEDAEDVAQEVFIEVHRSIQKFRADAKISTWLYRIAVNRSLNFIRDNKKRKWFKSFDDVVKTKNAELPKMRENHYDDPEHELEKQQRANLLHEAINSLSDNQKTAFSLNKYDDLSYQEISEVMNLSVSSVESLIHRAKMNLQKKLHTCYKKKCI